MTGRNIKLPLVAGALVLSAGSASGAGAQSGDAAALRAALEDEYHAEATYAAVIATFGEVRPFINIIEAERRHAAQARLQMDRLGISYDPTNPFLGILSAPASVLAACEQGVEAELKNIALYDKLLPTIVDPEVRETLTQLQSASRDKHLPAFQRCVDRGGQGDGGRGRGAGRRRSS